MLYLVGGLGNIRQHANCTVSMLTAHFEVLWNSFIQPSMVLGVVVKPGSLAIFRATTDLNAFLKLGSWMSSW